MDESPPQDPIEQRLAALESAVEEIRDALAHTARQQRAAAPPQRSAPPPGIPAAPARKPAFDNLKAALPGRPLDLESWLGQNALLVVGILALVAAIGFTLKYAFDQGWVSPAARVGAGLVAAVAIAVYGERLVQRGLRRFGAGLQGAGAAIAYLSAWAAAGPFQFVPSALGIVALSLVSGFVLLTALRNSEEYLAGMAAAGAYLAPMLLGDAESVSLLLAYSLVVSAAVSWAALLRGWRLTFVVVILGYFLMGAFAWDADAAWRSLYITVGGGVLLAAALWRNWMLAALLAWHLAWVSAMASTPGIEGWGAWLLVVGPAALVWPIWRRAIGVSPGTGARLHADERWGLVATTMFYATAVAWVVVATEALPPPADAYPLLAAVAIALLFLVPGLLRGNAAMHLAGLAVLATGVVAQWGWLGAAAGLSVLGLFAALTTRSGPLAENRWSATALVAVGAYALFGANAEVRPENDPALVGRWAQTLYLNLASIVAIAGPLWQQTEERWEAPGGFRLHTATWLLAAVVAISGGTIEIPEFVVQHGGSELAAGLAVSAYWLILAGGLLAYGFWKDLKAVRLTGLAVAGLAIGKVIFVDLAELRALYRVGSLALLAVITLLGARAYYRRDLQPNGESADPDR
ncbi:MAG: DUF2339 domain-containing protein [Gemmatimonadota bacterium]